MVVEAEVGGQVLTLTYQRAGLVAGGTAALWLAAWRIFGTKGPAPRNWALRPVVLSLVPVLMVTLVLGTADMEKRWNDLWDADKAGSSRIVFWQEAAAIHQQADLPGKVVGIGYGALVDGMESRYGAKIHSYSDVLDALVVYGVLGLIGWLAVYWAILRMILRRGLAWPASATALAVFLVMALESVFTGQMAAFKRPPTFRQVAAFLRRTIRKAGTKPKYIISDKGPQFWCEGFKAWCPILGIRPRFGAVGKHGSIAVVERFIMSMKEEGLRRLLIPLRQRTFLQDASFYTAWYNEHRPHTALRGATLNERYFGLRPANRVPRFEPRPHWPRGSPCARPQVLIMGQPGAQIELTVTFEAERRHLPIVTLRRVA